jgi:hypothetical protein
MKLYQVFIIISILSLGCSTEKSKIKILDENDEANVLFYKPFSDVVKIAEVNTIEAGKKNVIIFKSGSEMVVPANAFVDANGLPVTGRVEIHFTEYEDVLDRFLTGIPMTYDTLGKTFVFESAAMCSVFGFQNNKPVFINQNNPPTIFLTSEKTNKDFYVYHFDTIQNKWIPDGKSKVENIKKPLPEGDLSFLYSEGESFPLRPEKLNPNKINITVDIPYVDEFPELKIFKNTQFQVHDPDNTYNPKDGDIEWDKVELENTQKEGWYKLKFTLGKKVVIYDVQPVFAEGDFEEAMKEYIKTMARLKEEIRIEAIIMEQRKKEGIRYHTFPLNSFGIINVDKINETNPKELQVVWTDSSGNVLPENVRFYLLFHSLNSYIQVKDRIKLIPDQKHSIIGVKGDSTYYHTFDDKYFVNENQKNQIIQIKLKVTTEKMKDKESLLLLLKS